MNGILLTYQGEDTDVTIPDNVNSIGDYAFAHCDCVNSITIPNSVTRIGSYAFTGCENLTSVSIPESVRSIGSYTFFGCYNMTSITIPAQVQSIDSNAFWKGHDFNESFETIDGHIDEIEIYGYIGSAAEEYAIKNGCSFHPILDDAQ